MSKMTAEEEAWNVASEIWHDPSIEGPSWPVFEKAALERIAAARRARALLEKGNSNA